MRSVFRFGFALALGLALMAGCSDENGGEGGSGGTAGTGGVGGMPQCQNAAECDDTNECTVDSCNEGTCWNRAVADGEQCTVASVGDGLCFEGDCLTECFPSSRAYCQGVAIDPIEPMCDVVVPDQADGCAGNESIENPAHCTPCDLCAGAVSYKLTRMRLLGNCNAGYDLDGCDGQSCIPGGLASGDGTDGVDNALGGSGAVFVGLGGDLSRLDQAFHDAICTGALDLEISIKANPWEGCATAWISASDVQGDKVALNVNHSGCVSGKLGTIPIAFGDVEGVIENAVVRMTVSPIGFSDGRLGGTVASATAEAMGQIIEDGYWLYMQQMLDINADLSGELGAPCDSLSVSMEIAGVALDAP